jgi:hypothetical protein
VSTAGLASTAYVDNAVSGLVDAAPGTLDTLNELAAALGDDANFATTVTHSIAAKQNQLTAGSNVTITTASTISVDLSSYATANTLNNYVLTTTADSTYADATATANSLSALSSRVDDVEAFTITIADNTIDINGGVIAAATLTSSLSTTMSTALGISDLATAATLSNYASTTDFDALETTVNGRQNITAIGDGLSLSNGTLSTAFSIGDYVTATTLATQLNAKQNTLSAGSNISITGSTIAVASTLSNAVATNTAKTGITAGQATAITTNTAKVGYTDALARSAISPAGDVSYNSSTGVISYTSQWTADSGKITTENVVLVPGHLIEVFDMGTITSSADYSMDAGLLSGSVDRVVECGILDQERLF